MNTPYTSWNNGKEVPRWGVAEMQKKWVPQQLGDVNKQGSGDSWPIGARHGDTATIHTDLQSGCGRSWIFAVRVWSIVGICTICSLGVVELVRSNLAPDFPLFHGADTPVQANSRNCSAMQVRRLSMCYQLTSVSPVSAVSKNYQWQWECVMAARSLDPGHRCWQ